MVDVAGREFPSASQISTVGPLGATDVQSALDLVAAAGPFFTTEQFPAYVLGSGGGSFTTLRALDLNTGSTRHLFALVHMAGGTTVAPTAAFVAVVASAKRTSGGTVIVNADVPIISTSIAAFAVEWAAVGTQAAIQFRASGGPTMRVTLLYSWIEVLPP